MVGKLEDVAAHFATTIGVHYARRCGNYVVVNRRTEVMGRSLDKDRQ